MYKVLGNYQNAGKTSMIDYCEEFLGERGTIDEARELAKSQAGAWDSIIIRNDNDEDVEEVQA